MMKKIKSPADLTKLQEAAKQRFDPENPCIAFCTGTGCLAYGTQKLVDTLKEEIVKRDLGDRVYVRNSGCHGFCERGPMAVIHPQKIFYQKIKLEDVPDIIEKTILKGEVIDRLLYKDPVTKAKIAKEDEVPFYKKQMRLVFGMNGLIEPTSIEDYLAIGGYSALAKALHQMQPQEVIDEVI
ncbi:MAG: NAD(P)H-dependent oxidoreductase subunit E, partial [Desulfobacteraceae bacterium]